MIAAVNMKRVRIAGWLAGSLLALCGATQGSAAVITATLGNPTPGFSSGSIPALFPDILDAQAGQPAPFDTGLGSDLFENGSATWTFSYGAIGATITSASIAIGIIDHDSQASGDQVGSFMAPGGSDQTSSLNSLFNASGGADGEYNVYSLTLPGSIFSALAAGSAAFTLDLTGPGLQTDILDPFAVTETEFNGFFLIHSTLTINTRDEGNGRVPVPGTLPLAGLGGLALLGITLRRRVARSTV